MVVIPAEKRGSPSVISNDGALEPAQTWPDGLTPQNGVE
jgi:hypothetical protein